MENTPYNQKIQQQLMEINLRHLKNLDETGKQVLESNLVPLVKPLIKYDDSVKEGSGLVSGLLSTFGLGAPTSDEGKIAGRKRGRPRKTAKGALSGLFDAIGLGQEDQAKLKAAGLFDQIADGFTTGFKMPFQLVNKVLGGAKTKKLKAGLIKIAKGRQVGGYKAHYGMESQTVKSGNGLNARAVGSGNVAAGIFDDIGDFVGNVKNVLPLAAMIGIGKKGKRGRPRKAGAVGVEAMAENKNALTGGKRRPGRPRKAGGPISGLLGAFGLGKDMEAGKKRGRPRKAGGPISGLLGAFGLGKDMEAGKKRGRPRKAGMEAGGLFDDILGTVGKVVKTTADVAPDAVKLFKMVKGKGAKCCGGASQWINHVKAFAKKHNMSYRDALKDARCKSSYKK